MSTVIRKQHLTTLEPYHQVLYVPTGDMKLPQKKEFQVFTSAKFLYGDESMYDIILGRSLPEQPELGEPHTVAYMAFIKFVPPKSVKIKLAQGMEKRFFDRSKPYEQKVVLVYPVGKDKEYQVEVLK